MADMAHMDDEKVLSYLTKIPFSPFKGSTVSEMSELLSINIARSYLTEMILRHDQDRFKFH